MRRPVIAQIAVASVLLLPVLILGETFTFSDYLNHVWTAQFSGQFTAGNLYPRWLDSSFSGMGAPSFYYYPPAFFVIASLVHALSLATIPTQYLIPIAAFIVSAASGGAMYALLRRHANASVAMIGGICYQALPYHLTDFYVRGALGEYTAYAFMPLIVLGMARVSRSERGGGALLCGSYAGLIYSHLPTTVLFSSALPAYALFLAITAKPDWKARGVLLAKLSALLVVGMAIAAAYLVPALALLPYMSPSELWAPVYLPDAWFIWKMDTWPLKQYNASMIALSCAMAIPSAHILVAERKDRPDGGEASFWAAVSLVSFPLILGLIPSYWQIGPIQKVQFPFRLLAVQEFAFVSSCALFVRRRPLALRTPVWFAAAAILVAASLPLAYHASAQLSVIPSRGEAAREGWESTFRDFDGFLPPQFYGDRDPRISFDKDHEKGDARFSLFATDKLARLANLPEARLADDQGKADAERVGSSLRVDVVASHADTLVLRKFYFPGWIAKDGQGRDIDAQPTSDGLVSFGIPEGSARYWITPGLPDVARASSAVSILSAAGLAIAAALSLRKRNDRRVPLR
jgi:hypothetical protein